jgi:hypothetical protein
VGKREVKSSSDGRSPVQMRGLWTSQRIRGFVCETLVVNPDMSLSLHHSMNHVDIHEIRYVLRCDHKKHNVITEQVRFFGRHPKTSVNVLFRSSQSMTVVFVCETALCQR